MLLLLRPWEWLLRNSGAFGATVSGKLTAGVVPAT
jgi:hypothetical protein